MQNVEGPIKKTVSNNSSDKAKSSNALLAKTITELNISRKNVGIYPSGHEQSERSLDQTIQCLRQLGITIPEFTIGVAKERLMVNHEVLDPKNAVFKEFAISLNRLDIASVTFLNGVEKSEVAEFYSLLATPSERLRASGGLQELIDGCQMPHIQIKMVDYRSLHLTDEREIRSAPSHTQMPSDDEIWQDFISHIVKGDITQNGRGVLSGDSDHIDPLLLAELLNSDTIALESTIAGYDAVIGSHLRKRGSGDAGQSKILYKFNSLLKNLSPELRKQFLAVTFNQIAMAMDPAAQGGDYPEILDGLTGEMVIEMLEYANQKGKEISPSLLTMISELSGIEGLSGIVASDHYADTISDEQMQTLFAREDYESYVDEDYDRLLSGLKKPPPQGDLSSYQAGEKIVLTGGKDAEPVSIEHLEQSLEERHLEMQIRRILIAYIDQPIDVDDYRFFVESLTENLEMLLREGNFQLLQKILTTLKRHAKEKEAAIAKIAEEKWDLFFLPFFVSRAVNFINAYSKTKPQESIDLLLALGAPCVYGMTDLYLNADDFSEKNRLADILKQFGPPAQEEALRRLDTNQTTIIVKLIDLLRQIGSPGVVTQVKPFLDHVEAQVKMKAVGLLLHFKDPEGVGRLRQLLHHDCCETIQNAINLAGHYKVDEVAGDLVLMIMLRRVRKSDYEKNERIIKALGQIGNPLAIPVLEKMARMRWTFHPAQLARQKYTIFQSLDNYPTENLNTLLSIGLKAKDKQIKAMCRMRMAGSKE